MSTLLVGFALKARLHSRTRKLVLIKLLDHAREDGTRIYPGLKSIADDAECSVSTARRTLKEFCQVGLLRRVRDGGSKRGDTAHYELDVELLVRLKRDELWPALEAAAAHQPMGHDDDDDDESGHAAEASRADESCENKGVMVEGFHGDSLPNRDLRVSSDDTRTLTRNLTSEREGARERESTPAIEGGPDGKPIPSFDAFLDAYPFARGDNRGQLRSAWDGIALAERQAAIDGIEAFVAERKAGGLKSRLSAPQYLSGRCWVGLEAKAAQRQTKQAAGAFSEVKGWSREWWLMLHHRIAQGARQRIGFMLQMADGGKSISVSAGDLAAAAARIGDLKPFLCHGREIDAWRPWLAERGARIPVFPESSSFRVFLPSETPPRDPRDDDNVPL